MNSLNRVLFSSFCLASLLVVTSVVASAQLRLPRASPRASVSQTVGVTDITINYSRPGVKGRKVWGEAPPEVKGEKTLDTNTRPEGAPIVPYGHIWRTGANEATQFIVTDDVMINGQKLPAGDYSLHTIPGKDEWTIVFNGTANQWGSFSYDEKKDTLRVKAKPMAVPHSQEWLTFSIEPATENSATVTIAWEKVYVPFTVSVDVVATTIAHAKEAVANAKADDWKTAFDAAGYAYQNGEKQLALQWTEKSLSVLDGLIAAKPTFQNLSAKANILLAAGRKDEGLATADKAIAQGKADKANTAAFVKKIADIRAGKQ